MLHLHRDQAVPLDPQAQAMIDAFAAGPALDYSTLTAEAFRARFAIPAPAGARLDLRTREITITSPVGAMRTRIYQPDGEGPWPIMVYFHGGGFVIGSPDTTDQLCRTLAARAEMLVVAPYYRLAPEAPFPAGLEDARAALEWCHLHAGEIGGIASALIVAGDSSGGNFAAVLAQTSRKHGPHIAHQLLLYPVLDCAFHRPSYQQFARGYFLTAEMMRWYWRQYLSDLQQAHDNCASPLRTENLSFTPPATILTAEYDVLRDEAERYAARLRDARVPVELIRAPGQIHGFLLQQGVMRAADDAIEWIAKRLRSVGLGRRNQR
jgi:acetyl esterase